jgi:hypothetical protein
MTNIYSERFDAQAKRAGDVLPEREPVERPPAGERGHRADDDEREHLPHHGGEAAPERADLPLAQRVERLDVDQHDRVRDRGEPGGQGGADERELDGRGALPPQRGDAVDEHRRERRAEEPEPDVGVQLLRAQDHDPEHDERRRPGADAHDPRVGQRVPGDALQERAAQPQRRADEQPEARARHPELTHDLLRRRVRVEVDERLPDRLQRHRARAERQAEHARRHQHGDGEQQARRERSRRTCCPRARRRGRGVCRHATPGSAFSITSARRLSSSA